MSDYPDVFSAFASKCLPPITEPDAGPDKAPCAKCGGPMLVYCCDVRQGKWTAECYDCDVDLGVFDSPEEAYAAANSQEAKS